MREGMFRRIPRGLFVCLGMLIVLVSACRRNVPTAKVKLAAAGLNNTCTLDESGKVSCFGPTYPLARVPAPGTQFTSLAADGRDACGLLPNKRVLCFGVCGERCEPPSGAFDEVALGSGGEACALSYPGTVECWGFGAPFHASPPAGVALHGLTVGESFACALDAQGRPVCWGDRKPALPEPPPLRGVRLLAADRTHVCAIDESSEIVCWGLFPLTPPHGRFIHLGGRWEQFCGVREGGTASCFGELKGRTLVPSQHYGSNLQTVAVGQNHFCGVSPQGKLDCWEEVMRFGEGILPANGRIIEPTPAQDAGPSQASEEPRPMALAHGDAGRPAPEPTLPSTPPADKPFSLTIDDTPLKIAGAVARTRRGSPAIDVVLSDHPLACSALAPGWQPIAKGEHRVSLTLSSLLLEPMSDRTYSRPRTSPLRVRHVGWPAPGQELGGGLEVSASGIAVVEDLDAMRAGRPTRVQITNESTFGPVGKSPATTLRMEGGLGVTSCAPSIPTGDTAAQPDLELMIGDERVTLVSAMLRQVGEQRSLVLSNGPRSCPRSAGEQQEDDVRVVAYLPPMTPQLTFSGDRLPSDLGIVGTGVDVRELPGTDASHVDFSVAILHPSTRFPLAIKGTAHAVRCPPVK